MNLSVIIRQKKSLFFQEGGGGGGGISNTLWLEFNMELLVHTQGIQGIRDDLTLECVNSGCSPFVPPPPY